MTTPTTPLPPPASGHPRPSGASPRPRPRPPVGRLSEREVEVLQLVTKGLTNGEAAEILGLSRATVRTHLEHVYSKLEVTNRVEAAVEGLRRGLVTP